MEEKKDKASIGMKILSFLIPLVGIILFFVKKKEQPGYAKGCGIAALIGIVVGVIIIPIIVVGVVTAMGMAVVKTTNDVLNSDDFKNSLSALETATYNAPYEAYEGTKTGAQIKTLISIIKTHNNSEYDNSRMIALSVDGSDVNVQTASNAILAGKTYSVEVQHNKDGLVNKVLITTKDTSTLNNTITNTTTNTLTNSIDSTNTITNTTNTVSNTLTNTSGTIVNTLESSANTLTDALGTSTNVLTNSLTDAAGAFSNALSSFGF